MTPQAVVWLVVGIGMVLFVAADVSLSLSRRRVGRSTEATSEVEPVFPDAIAPRMEMETEAQAEPEPFLAATPVVEPEPVYAPSVTQQHNGSNGNGAYALADDEPALVVVASDDGDAFDAVTAMRRAAAADAAQPLSEVRVLDSTDAAGASGASWVFDDRSGNGSVLDVPARSAFLLVLESIGTPRSVGAIARAATNDPELAIRAEALRALARLVTDDGEVWAGIAAGAARTVIAQRAKGEDDVARARDLLATVDVVLYEA